METHNGNYEVVRVTQGFCLFDAEFYQRKYQTKDSEALIPGYYIVTWPDEIRIRRFNEQANFQGPYDCRHKAESFVESLCSHRATMRLLTLKLAKAAQSENKMPDKKVA